jgi:hypothetical protein
MRIKLGRHDALRVDISAIRSAAPASCDDGGKLCAKWLADQRAAGRPRGEPSSWPHPGDPKPDNASWRGNEGELVPPFAQGLDQRVDADTPTAVV